VFQLYPGISVEFGSNKITLCFEHEGSVFKIQKSVRSFFGCSADLPSHGTDA